MLPLICLLIAGADTAPASPPPQPPPSLMVSSGEDIHEPPPPDLGRVRRIFVDVFTGGESAAHLREEIINALQKSKVFVVTENEQRADAVLKGAAKDEAFTDRFHSSENANGRSQSGSSDGEGYGRSVYTRSSRTFGGGLGDGETVDIEERKHEARAAVRLVTPDGDVMWSTTQESVGAKFMSASEDVAQRVAKQLLTDYKRECAARPPR